MTEPTSTFREAVKTEAPAPVKEQKIADIGSPVQTHIDSLLATYSEDQGKPFIANYLEVDGIWDKDKTLQNELNTIEGYLKDQIKNGKLENSTKAGKKYLQALEKKAETNPYDATNKRISKILAYIEFQRVVHG